MQDGRNELVQYDERDEEWKSHNGLGGHMAGGMGAAGYCGVGNTMRSGMGNMYGEQYGEWYGEWYGE